MFNISEQAPFKNDLREAILKTVAFFDLFDYPLTAYEIYRYLARKFGLGEVITALEEKSRSSQVQERNGFYYLSGRDVIVAVRSKRYNYTRRKIKIAARFARLFSYCPFVKTVMLANCLGAHNLRDGSDIDFFIITAPHRLWLSRFYCAGLAKLLNSRPRADKKRDKICLSFYAAANQLNLDNLRLAGGDPYFDYWLKDLVLLYNKDKVYERFLTANNLAGGTTEGMETLRIQSISLFDGLEKIVKKFQLKIMPSVLRAAMNNSDGVIVNDHVLKFYLRDRRREFREKYGHKVNAVLSANN